SRSGFVEAVLRAYGGHFHLEIRPDDVWITILTQFSMFVNANAERFRYKFVSFEGKQTLRIVVDTLTSGEIAVEMGKLLQENIVDPDLREWIVPHFTTTTAEDTSVSSAIMMATLKEYFNYEVYLLCGIPSVTLHGEKKDWEMLYRKIHKLKEFGLETTMWYHLLEPILGRFVRAWDDPDGEWNKQFWARAATTHNHGGFCGPPPDLTGWITAFMPFNDEGKWQFSNGIFCVIDGAWYPKHPQDQIPRAVVNVPVRVFEQGRKFESQLVAGVMGFDVTQVPKSNGNEPEPVATTPAGMQPEPYYPHLDNAEKSAEVSYGPYDAWDM
ncbi:hypothetical protein BDZ91DRAFT_841595, partial [Kalaharituber pfeilii]